MPLVMWQTRLPTEPQADAANTFYYELHQLAGVEESGRTDVVKNEREIANKLRTSRLR